MPKFAVTGASLAAEKVSYGRPSNHHEFGNGRYSLYVRPQDKHFSIFDHHAGIRMTTNAVIPYYASRDSVPVYSGEYDFYWTDRCFGKFFHAYRLSDAKSGYKKFPLLSEEILLGAVEAYQKAYPQMWEEVVSTVAAKRLEEALTHVRTNRRTLIAIFAVSMVFVTLFAHGFDMMTGV